MRYAGALVVALTCLVTGASAAEPEPVSSEPLAPEPGALLIKIRTVSPKKSPLGEVLVNLTRRLELDSKDAAGKPRLAPRVDWQIPSEERGLKACEGGKIGGLAISFGALSASVPELAAIELPYLFEGYAKVDGALDGARSLIVELLRDKGFVFVFRAENGFRSWASKTSFLAGASDFSGRALRVASPVGRAIAQTLGALPKSVDDVARRLVSGELDGYEGSLLLARQAQWANEITFVTLTRHAYDGAVFVWCKPWLDTIAPELQALVTHKSPVLDALEARGLELARRFNDELTPRQYTRAGKQLRELTPSERDAMKLALAPIEAAFVAATSPKGQALLAALKR